MMLKRFALVLAAGCALSGEASAVIVNCPSPIVDRGFRLDTTVASTCIGSGTGNINGNNDSVNNIPPGYITLDKSDDTTTGLFNGSLSITGTGTLSGTFTLTLPAGYFDFVLALKSGEGNGDPDWAAFKLAAGTVGGSWAIVDGPGAGAQSLSHANLYGRQCPPEGCPGGGPGPSPVPLPAPFLLLGLAVGVLGVGRWWKNRRAQEAV